MVAQGKKKGVKAGGKGTSASVKCEAGQNAKQEQGWRSWKVWQLVLALVLVVGGTVLFVGAVAGWFSSHKVVLDAEYYAEGAEFMDLTAGEYEGLVGAKKSFVVMVDQGGCTTADRLREYVTEYMTETGILVYRMMFSEVKESSLHDDVKYYPSVVVVDNGVVRGYLRADSDEDAVMYNDYAAFKSWLDGYLR